MPVLGSPGLYAAWASWLDAFGRGEDLPDAHLEPIGPSLGPHMQERLMRHLASAFEARARRWSDTLARHLATNTVRRPAELAAALVAARGRLRPLRRLATDPRLPEPVRAELARGLDELTRSAQDSLEQSARRNVGLTEQLIAVVRANSLLVADGAAPRPNPPNPGSPRPTGRRVIL